MTCEELVGKVVVVNFVVELSGSVGIFCCCRRLKVNDVVASYSIVGIVERVKVDGEPKRVL